MNVSSTSSGSALDALAAALARQKTSSTGSVSTTAYSQTAASTGCASEAANNSTASSTTSTPSSFNVQMSTSQFAAGTRGTGSASGHHGGHGNPIAKLDTDGDGSVSSDEFGLSTADSDVKNLFSAIDSDSDGSLSSSELSAFDTKMQDAMQAKIDSSDAQQDGSGMSPMGPPPGPPPQASSSSSSDSSSSSSSSTDSSSSSSISAAQVQDMLQRIAQGYLSLMGSNSSAATSSTSSSKVSLTA
jgi:hypothetical protein